MTCAACAGPYGGMKFAIADTFQGISLTAYEALYFAEDFNVALCLELSLERSLVEFSFKDGMLRRVTQVVPSRDIPGPVAALMGGGRLEYTEHVEYRAGSMRGTWKTVPSLMRDKVDSHGTFQFAAEGDAVVRRIEGEVKVKVFGIGGVVERFVVADVERSYADASTFTRGWLSKGHPIPAKLRDLAAGPHGAAVHTP